MSEKRLDRDLISSLETSEALLPHMPELLADLWALGSSPGVLTDVVRSANLPPAAGVMRWTILTSQRR